MALDPNPRYIEQLVIGGGITNADGGAYIDKHGNIVTTGDITASSIESGELYITGETTLNSASVSSLNVSSLSSSTSSLGSASASSLTVSGSIAASSLSVSTSISCGSVSVSGDISCTNLSVSTSILSNATSVSLFPTPSTINIAGGSTGDKYVNIGTATSGNVMCTLGSNSSGLMMFTLNSAGSSWSPRIDFRKDGNRRYSMLLSNSGSTPNFSLDWHSGTGNGSYAGTVWYFDYANTRLYLGGAYVSTVDIGSGSTTTLNIRPSTIATTNTTQNLFNTTVTTMNFAGAATSLTMGANGSGTTNIRNALQLSSVKTITVNDTQPSVSGANIFQIPSNWSSGNNITNFVNGVTGQVIVILGGNSNCVIVDNSNLLLNGNFTAASGSTLVLLYTGNNWIELSRSVNG